MPVEPLVKSLPGWRVSVWPLMFALTRPLLVKLLWPTPRLPVPAMVAPALMVRRSLLPLPAKTRLPAPVMLIVPVPESVSLAPTKRRSSPLPVLWRLMVPLLMIVPLPVNEPLWNEKVWSLAMLSVSPASRVSRPTVYEPSIVTTEATFVLPPSMKTSALGSFGTPAVQKVLSLQLPVPPFQVKAVWAWLLAAEAREPARNKV